MITKVATIAVMFDEFGHIQDINTILFDKNKFGNEYFEVDCQSSDGNCRWRLLMFDKFPDMQDINRRSVDRINMYKHTYKNTIKYINPSIPLSMQYLFTIL